MSDRRKKCIPDVRQDIFRQFIIMGSLLRFSEHRCRPRRDPGAVQVVHFRDKTVIRAAEYRIRLSVAVKRQPVSELELLHPAVTVLLADAHVFHPGLHGVEALRKNGCISRELIDRPGHDRRDIAPCGAAEFFLVKRRHNDGYHAAQHLLLGPEIVQELPVKSSGVALKKRSRAEHLRVAGPAHSLVALRAVRRHIDEVIHAAPVSVRDQPVDFFIAGRERTRPIHIRSQSQRREIRRIHVRHALDLHISISVKSKRRLQRHIRSVGRIPVLRLCGAQIAAVKAIVLQHLAELQMDPAPARRMMKLQVENSRKVLTHVHHGLALRGDDLFFYGKLRGNRDRYGETVGYFSLGRIRQARRNGGHRRQGVVALLAVIDIGKRDIRARYLPALIRANGRRGAVLVAENQLGQQFPGVSVPGRLQIGEAEAALVPAVAQRNGQRTRSADAVGHIVRLHLHPAAVIVAARREKFISDLFSIDRRLVETEAGDVQPCTDNPARRMDLL